MLPVQFTDYDFKIKDENSRKLIFDALRKRWVVLTPEEWVRQNFVQYLIQVMQYPAVMIAIEKELMLGDLKKRFDILVYDSNHRPWMMVECKAQDVVLNDAVLQQVLRYNMAIPVPFMIITNGSYNFGFEKKDGSLEMMQQLPVLR